MPGQRLAGAARSERPIEAIFGKRRRRGDDDAGIEKASPSGRVLRRRLPDGVGVSGGREVSPAAATPTPTVTAVDRSDERAREPPVTREGGCPANAHPPGAFAGSDRATGSLNHVKAEPKDGVRQQPRRGAQSSARDAGDASDASAGRTPLPDGWTRPVVTRRRPDYAFGPELRTAVRGWKRRRRRDGSSVHSEDSADGADRSGGEASSSSSSLRGEALQLLAGAAAGPYCTLRTLSRVLKLSPFTLDALVAALARPAPSRLIDEIHVALLAALCSDDVDANAALPGPALSATTAKSSVLTRGGTFPEGGGLASGERWPEPRDSAAYLDAMTWPDYLDSMLARTRAKRGVRHVPSINPHGYYTLQPEDKTALLAYLCDELLQTAAARDELDTREGMDLDGEGWVGEAASAAGPTTLVGAAVEVHGGDEEGMRGSYYSGVVLAATHDRVRVRYDELLQDDSRRQLEEWVELGEVQCDDTKNEDDEDNAASGDAPKAGRKYLTVPRVRPLPPPETVRARSVAKRSVGDRVEAWWHEGWWYGRVLESAEPDGQVSVYFPGEGDVLKMMRKDVRTALTWDGAGGRDGTWYVAGTDELVTPAGEKGVGEEAEEKEDTADEENGDGHVDMCMVCLGPGSLICCDGCPSAYHMSCVGETRASLPDDDWYCPECVALPRGLKCNSRRPSSRDNPLLVMAYNPPLRVPPLGMDSSGRSYWAAHGRMFRLEGGVLSDVRCAGLEGPSAALLRSTTTSRKATGHLTGIDKRRGKKGASGGSLKRQPVSSVALGSTPADVALSGEFCQPRLRHFSAADAVRIVAIELGDIQSQNSADGRIRQALKRAAALTEDELALAEECAAVEEGAVAAADADGTRRRNPDRSVRLPEAVVGRAVASTSRQSRGKGKCEGEAKDGAWHDGSLRGLAAATADACVAVAADEDEERGVGVRAETALDWMREESWEEALEYTNHYAAAGLWQCAKTHTPSTRPGRRGSGVFQGSLEFRFTWPPATGFSSGTSSACKLTTVVARLLHMERLLYGVLEGTWADGDWRAAWHAKVFRTTTAAALAPRLLELEAALLTHAIHPAWHNSFVEEKIRPTERPPRVDHIVGPRHFANLVMPVLMHRTRISLPAAAVRRLARRAGVCKLPPGVCSYVQGRGHGGPSHMRRTVRGAWRGEVERARSTAALALQLRALDAHVRWEALRCTPTPGACKSGYRSKKTEKAEKEAAMALVINSKNGEKPGELDDAVLPLHVVSRRQVFVEATGQVESEYQLAGRAEPLSHTTIPVPLETADWKREGEVPLYLIKKYVEALRSVSGAPTNLIKRGNLPSSCRSFALLQQDIGPHLKGATVELLRGDDGRQQWCRGEIADIDMAHGASMLYPESGETEQVSVNGLLWLARSGHVRVLGRIPKRRGRPLGLAGKDSLLESALPPRARLEELVMLHTGRDVTRQKLARRKLAALLPREVLEETLSCEVGDRTLDERGRGQPPRSGDDRGEGRWPGSGTRESVVRADPKLLSPAAAAAAFGARARQACKDVVEALRDAVVPQSTADTEPRRLALLFEKLPTPKQLPYYYRIIHDPVDIKTISARLRKGSDGGFKTCREFANAVELMFSNAEDFNTDGSQIHADAGALREVFLRAMRENFPKEPLPRPHAPIPDPSTCYILGGPPPPDATLFVGIPVRVWRTAPGSDALASRGSWRSGVVVAVCGSAALRCKVRFDDDSSVDPAVPAVPSILEVASVGRSLRVRAQRKVGEVVAVESSEATGWHAARVHGYDPTSRRHLLVYDTNGQHEWAHLSSEAAAAAAADVKQQERAWEDAASEEETAAVAAERRVAVAARAAAKAAHIAAAACEVLWDHDSPPPPPAGTYRLGAGTADAMYAREAKAGRRAAAAAVTAAIAAADDEAKAAKAEAKRAMNEAEAERERARRAIERRLDAAKEAKAFLREAVSPEDAAKVASRDAGSSASKSRLTVHEAERCLAVLDILRGAHDAPREACGSGVKKHEEEGPRWLDASFCWRLPSRAECPWFYAAATHPVDLSAVEKKARQRAYGSIAEFCADCEWVFDNASAFVSMAEIEGGSTAAATAGVAADGAALRKLFRREAIAAFVPLTAAAASSERGGGAAPKLVRHPHGPALVGRRLFVYWPDDDVWYVTRCVAYAPKRGHLLRYALDGEEEWVADLDKGGAVAKGKVRPSASARHTAWIPESPGLAAPLDVDAARALLRVLDSLARHSDSQGRRLADVFYRLPSREEFEEYYRLIRKPVDLAMIVQRLLGGEYANAGDFAYDCELMFANAMVFNEPGGWVYTVAGRLQGILRKLLAKHVQGYEPPPEIIERPPILQVGAGVVGTAGAAAGGAGGNNEAAKHPGRAAVGLRVKVFWKDRGVFFSGRVTSFNRRTRRHTVTYDDGDVENLALGEETIEWVSSAA